MLESKQKLLIITTSYILESITFTIKKFNLFENTDNLSNNYIDNEFKKEKKDQEIDNQKDSK